MADLVVEKLFTTKLHFQTDIVLVEKNLNIPEKIQLVKQHGYFVQCKC